MRRASGILLHVTSLPSVFGIGDLGPKSYQFADLLSKHKQRFWSILPLSPTRLEDGNSPYQPNTAFAGNPLLISPEKIVESDLLPKEYIIKAARKDESKVDYPRAYARKEHMLELTYTNFHKFKGKASSGIAFDDFCSENASWINDYAFYAALRRKSDKPWYRWPTSLRHRERQAVARKESAFKEEIEKQKFIQWLFFSQLFCLKDFCRNRQVSLIGDMPFYLTYDSADVWVHPELFSLNENGKLQFVGGVPPDYFSSTGQLWGNPVYDWKKMRETDFEWWLQRIRHNLRLFDLLRLDHFRGFNAYWQVPAKAKTAKKGCWVKAPSESFFETVKKSFPSLPFIAEDLGSIDDEVRNAISQLGIPGMKVLLFAFDGSPDNIYLPKNYSENCVVYTGTHDTNTARGWFVDEASNQQKRVLFNLIGKKVGAEEVSFEMVKLASASKADLNIVPFQDVLGLGSKARMNNPGRLTGNWEWRANPKQLTSQRMEELLRLTIENQRS